MSGAEPCTASKIDASLPMLPEGVRPRPPIRPAHMSDKMSPYKLGMTITRSEYGAGFCVICRQTRSSRSSSYLMLGNSFDTSRHADKNMPSDIFLNAPSSSVWENRDGI